MAGMLPGVECARRRRFHGGTQSTDLSNTAGMGPGAGHVWTRRPSFSLYTTNYESHQAYVSFSERSARNESYGEVKDEKLDGVAKEAKERLDERLRNPRRRQNGKDKVEQPKGKSHGELPTKVVGLKKSRGRLIEWFGWRVREQQDCAICLDRFKKGETLVHLPCAHKFHSICLLPWLDKNVYCPYCRTDIWN